MNASIEINRGSTGLYIGCDFLRRILPAVMAVLLSAIWPMRAYCADDFYGVLSLAVQDDVAAKLQLSPEQKSKLQSLLDDRESKAVDLVMQKDLPAAEREQKLAAFRQESETKGLALLNAEQQKMLEQIRLGRLGLASLAEPAVAERLALSEEQIKQIADILEKRKQDLTKTDEKKARVIQALAERNLTEILTEKQKADWNSMALTDSAPADASAPTAESKPAQPDQSKSQETAAEKPPPASTASTSPAKPRVELPKHPDQIRFKFAYAPWKDVLNRFAEQADFSLVGDKTPSGTFNYIDDKTYTPKEAIDILNRVLLLKGFYLLRRDRMLMVIDLEDGIPPGLVPVVPIDSLNEHGESEIVSVIFDLIKPSPDEAAAEIEKLRQPQTAVVTLPKSRELQVTDTVARLRVINGVIKKLDDKEGTYSGQLKTFTLHFVTPEDILPNLRQLLDIPAEQYKTPDGSLLLTVDTNGKRLIATGRPERLARLEDILKVIDAPRGGGDSGVLEGSPQFETYSIDTADPQLAEKVMQTLLAGLPDVRMNLDSKTNTLFVLARPAQHATIRAALDQLQHDARQVAVIRLKMVDPQTAVLSIKKLFGTDTDATKSGSGPQVDADPATRQLLIRGTTAQIDQIKSLLQKMGEPEANSMVAQSGGKVRMLPLSARQMGSALERIQQIWPTMHPNSSIRVMNPANAIPTFTPSAGEDMDMQQNPSDQPRTAPSDSRLKEKAPDSSSPREKKSSTSEQPSKNKPSKQLSPPDDRTTGGPVKARFQLVADEVQIGAQDASDTKDLPKTDASKPNSSSSAASAEKKESASIIVAPTPGGVMIASEDEEALNEFEKLLTSLAGGNAGNTPRLNMFFLTHAKAAVVANTLIDILGGTVTTANTNAGGGTFMGDMMGAALGDTGGGILQSLMGGGGSGRVQPSGTIKITPDSRLNALIVQANDKDLDTIDQLLKILDQKDSLVDVQVNPRPKMIPLYNTDATTVAGIVQEVYRDRMVLSSAQNQGVQGMGGPAAFMQMMTGGRGGRGGRGGNQQQGDETPKLSISVDERSNSLIVAAPESLFEDVKQLVEMLDTVPTDSNESIQVVTLHRSSTQSVEQALSALGGENIQITRTQGSSGGYNPQYQFGQGRGGYQNYNQRGGGPGGQFRGGNQYAQRGGGAYGGGTAYGGGGQRGGAAYGGGGQRGGGGGNYGAAGFQRGGGGGNFGGGAGFGGGRGGMGGGGNFGGGMGGGGNFGGGRGGGGGGGGGGQRGGGGGIYAP